MIDKSAILGAIKNCQVCSGNLETIINFGHHAPVNAFLTKDQLSEPEITYPLNWCRCTDCGLMQIDYIPDPHVVFPDEFPYRSAMTNTLKENFVSLAAILKDRFNLTNNDLVIDIGSNDGTLLQQFKGAANVLGIEPTGVADIAIENGIPTIKKFFSEAVAREIITRYGKAKIVTATNVFAHINNPFQMTNGIMEMLTDDGIFISESQYILDILEKLEYDTVYHEHLRYYSLKSLMMLMEKSGFTVIDAERIPVHGGSIRVYAVKGRQTAKNLNEMLRKEEEQMTAQSYLKLRKRITDSKCKLQELLLSIKKEGNCIVGIGAPARGSMLLQYCRIDSDILDYTVERKGSLKIGLYTPGTHIPVVDEEKLFEEQPEYALLLSWNIGDEITRKLREKGFKGKFIMPLPEPRIIEDISEIAIL